MKVSDKRRLEVHVNLHHYRSCFTVSSHVPTVKSVLKMFCLQRLQGYFIHIYYNLYPNIGIYILYLGIAVSLLLS